MKCIMHVKNKTNKQWIWLTLDKNTGEIVGAYIGKRDKDAAQKLWESLPPVYRQCRLLRTKSYRRPSVRNATRFVTLIFGLLMKK